MKKTYYIDFYGCTASITVRPNGSALLVTYCGRKRESKTYKTERGAKIAMGKMSDCWRIQHD